MNQSRIKVGKTYTGKMPGADALTTRTVQAIGLNLCPTLTARMDVVQFEEAGKVGYRYLDTFAKWVVHEVNA